MIYRVLIFFLTIHSLQASVPMKVLVVVLSSFPSKQGAAILNHITGLIDHKCSVTIFSPEKSTFQNTHDDIKDYNLLDLVFYEKMPTEVSDCDIILAEFGPRGVECLPYKKGNIKLITCFRGADMGPKFQKNPHFYRELFAQGDLFLPVCKAFKKKLIRYGCPAEKIKVLHSGVDCDLFFYKKREINDSESIKLISVCRLVEKKGLEYAIKAVANLINQGFNIEYSIVGEGLLRKHLEQLVIRNNVQNKIFFLGKKQLKDVVQCLHKNHIFILPSITADDGNEEGIPNAAKEAMACGLPVILTNHSGNTELVKHNVSGLIVKQRSVTDLEQAITYLIENKQLWNAFGKAGREEIINSFEKNILNKKLFHMLQVLLHKI